MSRRPMSSPAPPPENFQSDIFTPTQKNLLRKKNFPRSRPPPQPPLRRVKKITGVVDARGVGSSLPSKLPRKRRMLSPLLQHGTPAGRRGRGHCPAARTARGRWPGGSCRAWRAPGRVGAGGGHGGPDGLWRFNSAQPPPKSCAHSGRSNLGDQKNAPFRSVKKMGLQKISGSV